MQKLIKIKDHKNLLRDVTTNAIINTDQQEYENYLKRKKSIDKKDEKIEQLQSEIDYLKNSLDEIKSLIAKNMNS